MMKTATILRVATLFVIFGACIVCTFAVPDDGNENKLAVLFVTKSAAAVLFACGVVLYRRWVRCDEWLKAYDENLDKD